MKKFWILFASFAIALTSFAQDTVLYSNTLHFALDQYTVDSGELNALASALSNKKNIVHLSVTGYCDDRGSVEYNKILASNRVNAVYSQLKPHIQPASFTHQLSAVGELDLNQASTVSIKEQRASNRRVDVVAYVAVPKTSPALLEPSEPLKPLKPEASTPLAVFNDSLAVGDKITLENILFIGGRHFILPESKDALNNLVDTLQKYDQYNIKIIGHICCLAPGNDGEDFDTGKHNLSEARAKAIYDHLRKNGIEKSRLQHEGRGSNFPTGRGAKYDRRVEVEIIGIIEF